MANSQPLLERLKHKPGYEKFMKDNPDSFLYAIFAILSNNEKEGDKIQFDFFTPSTKKIAYSEYPFDEIKVQNQEAAIVSKKLSLDEIQIDVENLWEVVEKIQLEKKDSSVITKIIGVLREGVWDLTCTTATIDMLRIKVNAVTKECVNYKKENLTNFIQIRKGNK
jgi:hypothetical protein